VLTTAYDHAKDDVLTPLAVVAGDIDTLGAAVIGIGLVADDIHDVVSPGVEGGGAVTLTIHDTGGTDIPDADVWVRGSSSTGGPIVQSGTTNASGQVTFTLTAGATYYLWREKSGVNFTNPVSFVAVAD
jgi:hypothetical protein